MYGTYKDVHSAPTSVKYSQFLYLRVKSTSPISVYSLATRWNTTGRRGIKCVQGRQRVEGECSVQS